MKRTATSVAFAIGLTFASVAGGAATAHASTAAPVASVQMTAFNRTEHPATTEAVQAIQIPGSISKIAPRMARVSFSELKHPWYNLVHLQRVRARRARAARRAAELAAQQQSAPVYSASTVSTQGMGAFQACVISRESGGNPQIMNSTGHYGLYQFSEQTWVAAGGSAADFGHASVAEQNQVFDNAYRMWGTSPWAPYDGC